MPERRRETTPVEKRMPQDHLLGLKQVGVATKVDTEDIDIALFKLNLLSETLDDVSRKLDKVLKKQRKLNK